MDNIIFSLTRVSDAITDKTLYRANVQTNGTLGRDELAERLAERTKQDVSLWKYFLDALSDEIGIQLLAGYRINLGQLTTGFTEDGQRIVCTLASAVPAGTYYVRLVSHGLDPTAPLSTVLHKVTVKAAATPPTPIAQSSDGKVKVMSAVGGGEGGAFTPDEDWTLEGEGLWGEFAEDRTWILSGPEVSAGGASYPATFGELAGGVAKVTLEHAPEEPGEYAAELSFSLTNVDPEVDSETLRVPFTLVVA